MNLDPERVREAIIIAALTNVPYRFVEQRCPRCGGNDAFTGADTKGSLHCAEESLRGCRPPGTEGLYLFSNFADMLRSAGVDLEGVRIAAEF